MKKKIVNSICLVTSIVMLSGCGTQQTQTDTSASDSSTEETTVESTDVVLDYAQGIADGVYGWTLSEDGSFYILSAINEDGTPVESTAQQNFMNGGGQGGMKGQNADSGDALAMENNEQSSTVTVNAQGVYTESNITNTEYQTMLVYVPADYMTVNEDGSATFTDTEIGGYTASTAPIVFQNSNGGWR